MHLRKLQFRDATKLTHSHTASTLKIWDLIYVWPKVHVLSIDTMPGYSVPCLSCPHPPSVSVRVLNTSCYNKHPQNLSGLTNKGSCLTHITVCKCWEALLRNSFSRVLTHSILWCHKLKNVYTHIHTLLPSPTSISSSFSSRCQHHSHSEVLQWLETN